MSKSFDEICNTVLGEDVNIALWENTNTDPLQAIKELAEKHKTNPAELGKAIIAHFNPPATPAPTTTQPNQTAQQTTPQNGQNTVNKAATPTQPNQPQQGTQPTK